MSNTAKKLGLGVALFGMLSYGGIANALPTVATNNAHVTIIEPLIVTANNDMDFGKVTKPTTTGTVVLTSAGSISSTTGGIDTVGGTPSAGTVNISGDSSQTVSVTVTDTTADAGLSLSSFTGTFGGQPLVGNTLSGATLTGAIDVMAMGATLNIDSTAPGFTTGAKVPTYNVEVSYN